MGSAPSTVVQALFLVFLVMPGITYQFLRERWRGPIPAEGELGQRVLRAVVASAVLDALYAITVGPELLEVVRGPGGAWDVAPQRLRLVGLLAIVLFIVIPALAAALVSWLQRRKSPSRYITTPTAWDHAWRNRGSCFVRGRLKDGTWIGGWYGSRSFATTFPHSGELFLETARQMESDGRFGARVENTAGIYLRSESMDFIEFIEPGTNEAPDEETDG